MAKRRSSAPSLRIREFLTLVHDGIVERLGASLDGLAWRQRFGYLQYYRGSTAIHYEIWVQRKTERLEIGLHFEGADGARNYEAAALLGEHAPAILAAVGPEYELEEWTAQWARLHRSFAAPSLTPKLAEDAAERAVALISGMEPIVEELGLRE